MHFIGFGNIFGAPSLTNLFEITQPNGTKFRAYLKGDEFFSWWESEKGTVLFRNLESGYFEYAKISKIDNKDKLSTTGVIFAAKDETNFNNLRFSKLTKINLGKIWRQKRVDAKKRLKEIIVHKKIQGSNN